MEEKHFVECAFSKITHFLALVQVFVPEHSVLEAMDVSPQHLAELRESDLLLFEIPHCQSPRVKAQIPHFRNGVPVG